MTRQQHVLMTIVGILGMFLLTGCSAAASDADLTTDPTPSIVWSDDFEDGNLDGWEIFYAGNFWVDNGVLSSKTEGDLYHLSTVLSGTWSFDLYLISNPGLTHEVQFTDLDLPVPLPNIHHILLLNRSEAPSDKCKNRISQHHL